jgi:hypothetical protein
MTVFTPLKKTLTFVGLLLGNFSVWWGFCTLPIYVVGFVLLQQTRGTGGAMTLPMELPLIGLALAGLGIILAGGEKRETVPGLIGFVLNAIPMLLAVALSSLQGRG